MAKGYGPKLSQGYVVFETDQIGRMCGWFDKLARQAVVQ